MRIDELHPAYVAALDDFQLMRDTYRGERRIKDLGEVYLPATGGMRSDGMQTGEEGLAAYQAYKQRAVFHEFVFSAVMAMVGIMHAQPPKIEVPKALEPLLKSATVNGEGLETLLRRVNMEQLLCGRVGLLLDLPAEAGPQSLPYIATYIAEAVINWDTRVSPVDGRKSFDFVVLDESEPVRKGLAWEPKDKYRMLTKVGFLRSLMGDGFISGADDDYVVVLTEDGNEIGNGRIIVPSMRGRTLQEIPFVVCGSTDLDPVPDLPPLSALARKSVGLYRLEADYRQQLFMQSQDTLVLIGYVQQPGAPPPRVGANAVLHLEAGMDAKYVGVNSQGLPEMRQAVEAEKQAAAELGAQIIDAASTGSAASGEALSIRVAARTATLSSVARTGADGLRSILQAAARWAGANPDEVIVEANTDFGDEPFTADMLLKLMQAKGMGAPISRKTVHSIIAQNDMTSLTYDEEIAEIETEDEAGMPAPRSAAPGNANADPNDPQNDNPNDNAGA